MGFKITHPLLPSRLPVWPLWHGGGGYTLLQIECLAPMKPQNGHSASTSTSSLQLSRLQRHQLPHLFSCFKVAVLLLLQCLYSKLLFILMLLSVYWFLSVFGCHYTCGHRGYRSPGVFCLSSLSSELISSIFNRLIALLDSKELLFMYRIMLCAF